MLMCKFPPSKLSSLQQIGTEGYIDALFEEEVSLQAYLDSSLNKKCALARQLSRA